MSSTFSRHFERVSDKPCSKCDDQKCLCGCNSCINCKCKICFGSRCTKIEKENGKLFRCEFKCDGCKKYFFKNKDSLPQHVLNDPLAMSMLDQNYRSLGLTED